MSTKNDLVWTYKGEKPLVFI